MNSSIENATRYSLRSEESGPGNLILHVSGAIALGTVKDFTRDIESHLRGRNFREVIFDLDGIEYLDSAGALALIRYRDMGSRESFPVRMTGMNAATERMIGLIDRNPLPPPQPSREAPGLLERAGEAGIRFYHDAALLLLFIGDIAGSLAGSALSPRSIRWESVTFYMKKAGLDGLPIVGLISVLLGMIMAFMASLQLRLFGANIYVASLVSIAIVKELGPIMTAIIFAGRSGSAFSAEIGTMLVNEEIDALSTMGFDPVRFLVVPKVIASMLVVPILTLYADLLGILGGLVVGIMGMDLTVHSYMQQTMTSIQMFDLVSSIFKSVCFAVLIAAISCHRGFQASGGAEAVGSATTSAVVSSIFLIITADSAFAIMLHYI
ncbi:MAG: MlaE family lipid ABC transporter permease subunit [Syntrophales bacterium]|nr:MlaE family lipid ABC transporter permease subunit [Syntrophales bacterium]HPL63142.1 MlaE family lipid ABC transporter permease subunit [Syntrophales bacterium]